MTDWILIPALRKISKVKPDQDLGHRLDKHVPELVNRGWLKVCGCSDGNYVVITKKGREVLADD